MNNMTMPQLLMMLNPGAANTTYMQPDQEAMLRNQSISPYTPKGNVQMPNMQPFNIEGLLGALAGAGVGANVGVGTVNPAMGSGVMTDADANRLRNPVTGMVSDKEAELQMMKRLYGVR